MKKILLIFIITFISIISFDISIKAYTFNGSYDFSNIDLNASLTELNGASLNNLFDYEYLETLPLIEWNGYRNKYELDNQGNVVFNEYIYIDLGYKNLINLGTVSFNPSHSATILTGIDVIPNTTYNISLVYNGTGGIVNTFRVVGNNSNPVNDPYYVQNNIAYRRLTFNGTNQILNFAFTSGTNTTISLLFMNNYGYPNFTLSNNQLEYGNVKTDYVPYGTLTEVYRINSTPVENTDLVQSLYLYNLENMNIDLLNYYFAVFLLNKYALPVGDLWSYAWTAGNDAGYNDGYSTGYDDGNLDGYNDGYDEGLFDYHTGNYYGEYDYTLSEPYDQATQANISLLNIFSMIIGVAMSMLGFIINIDIFGISIASILGTLAIGVSIVWLLKLIRG